jgi:hypothetical protein
MPELIPKPDSTGGKNQKKKKNLILEKGSYMVRARS